MTTVPRYKKNQPVIFNKSVFLSASWTRIRTLGYILEVRFYENIPFVVYKVYEIGSQNTSIVHEADLNPVPSEDKKGSFTF